jgi:hypothetical protein
MIHEILRINDKILFKQHKQTDFCNRNTVCLLRDRMLFKKQLFKWLSSFQFLTALTPVNY